jgi:AcrR family transcriptional regulator
VARKQSAAPVGRGQRARDRVLQAALAVLAEEGMAGFTMEAIARRAGASKSTLYRHWSSPGELLVAAMDAEFRPAPAVSTEDLRADLIGPLTAFAGVLNHSPFPKLLAAFIDGAERHPALAQLHTELTNRRREPLLRVLADAAARGEISPDIDPELIVDLLAAPFFYRRFVAHRPIPAGMPAAVVDQVLASLAQKPTNQRRAKKSPSRSAVSSGRSSGKK